MDRQITRLLRGWKEGDQAALNELTPLVYDQLHRLAASSLRNDRTDHTLQPTALIHEAYLRMVGGQLPDFQSRSHFFAISARLMRQILVDHARHHSAEKRGGGGVQRIELKDEAAYAPEHAQDMLALDQALEQLRHLDERKCQMVELRYFAGLGNQEIADTLGISIATVGRELRTSVAYLNRTLTFSA